MIIDLHELLQEDNGNRSYHLQLEADVFETSTASYKIKDYDLQLSFHNEGKKHISSRCEGFVVLEIPCDRCLEPVDYKIDIDYFKDLDMNKTAEEKIAELDEDYYLEGTSFDTEVLIHNEVLVNLISLRRCKPCLSVQRTNLLKEEEIREELTGRCQLQTLLNVANVES